MKRIPLLLALAILLLILFPPGPAPAEEPKCTCRNGNGTYDFLNAPVTPPDDECHCPLGRAYPGGCPKKIPSSWDRTCYENGKMECFLRRHAYSWRIACSERLSGDCDCKNPHPEWCPNCQTGERWDQSGLDLIRKQLKIEQRLLGRRKFIVLKSPHFYLVTDIRRLKLKTRAGNYRIMTQHELGHLYIQRAEIAYQEFCQYFGSDVVLSRPCAIFLMDDNSTSAQVQAAYFGSNRTNIRYGGGSSDISGGYPFNGFSFSLQDAGDDYGLHLKERHAIGHILMSCYIKVAPNQPELPTWLYASAGHWLARLPRKFHEMATFCANEGTAINNSGKKWRQKLLKYVGGTKSVPIQRIFDVNAMSSLSLEMHIKGWSWFDVFLREDRERFVKFIRGIRAGKEHRIAMKEAFGCSPEEFEQRWKERILGRRPTVAPTVAELDSGDPSRPGAKERAAIRSETDEATLASKIRALQAVNDPLTAATVVPILRTTRSESVRETIVIVLRKTTSPVVRSWLRTEGLSGQTGLSRATVARVLGDLGDKQAGNELMKFTSDGFWLTRAHVARALGLIQHEPAVPVLKDMVDDSSLKVRIAVMEALGRFGERAGSAWEEVAPQLSAKRWQVRSAAAECLGKLGQMRACEAMISRMETESGRIRKDLREALKELTRDDLGNNPEHWRKWWDKLKARYPDGNPPRGEKPKEPPKGEIEYAPGPTFYGLQVFSEGVGYVLDVSSSMLHAINIDPAWIKRNRRNYPPRASKFDLARSEVAASLNDLDHRVRFNLYFFRTRAFTWKSGLVPASPSNVNAAVSRMANEKPSPPPRNKKSSGNKNMTNYVDAFRLVLDVKPDQALGGGFGDTPDTIFFLTDGTPTAGDITDTEVLVSWFNELNRFARLKVNVITFGNLGVDAVFLRRLAEENNGVFLQVPSVRVKNQNEKKN